MHDRLKSLCLLAAMLAAAAEVDAQRAEVSIEQKPGKVTYWILPGERRLSKKVFGTPGHPRNTGAEKMAAAATMRPPGIYETLSKLPILVGVPLQARVLDKDGNWVLKMPNMFSDKARVVSGSFHATYHDVVDRDPPGPPNATPDTVDLQCEFTDPAGNEYRIVLDHVIKPPFPGYETEGGVMIDSYHHGDTGTGSPLMPKVKTYAAFWGVGDVYINGKLAQPHRVMHMMTTEVVRDVDYKLAVDEELPLSPERRHISSQEHHTHFVVMPIEPVKGVGPTFKPLKTAFMLPNGMPQPFIHVMFEQDRIVPQADSGASVEITVNAKEFVFDPKDVTVRVGQKVTFVFENKGIITHNLTIEGLGIQSKTIHPKESDRVTFTPEKAGEYRIRCMVPGHMEAGMVGTLTVTK